MAVPAEPIIFTKATSCLSGPDDDVMLPQNALKGDWEVELGVFIGRTARSVAASAALDHVAGYTVVNDVSERAWQLERGSQWDKGKGFDTFGPVGPWLVTPDEVADPQALGMFLDINGRRMQSGNTRTMIFGVRELIAYVSTCMTLHPGDLLITGTPPGVGMGMKPQPVYLRPGAACTSASTDWASSASAWSRSGGASAGRVRHSCLPRPLRGPGRRHHRRRFRRGAGDAAAAYSRRVARSPCGTATGRRSRAPLPRSAPPPCSRST